MMNTSPAKRHTILWAEDDHDDRYMIGCILAAFQEQYQIHEAENGSEVLRFLHAINDPSQFPSLVVLDINMPKLSGLQTIAFLRRDERYKNLNIAVFTTSNSKIDRRMCERYGVPMFTKPSTYEAFSKAVVELLQLCHIEKS